MCEFEDFLKETVLVLVFIYVQNGEFTFILFITYYHILLYCF